MKSFKIISSVLLLASTVAAQYNYQTPQEDTEGYNYSKPPSRQPPTQPPNSYLPPSKATPPPYSRLPTPGTTPYETDQQLSPEVISPSRNPPPVDDTDHAPGMPYDFTYAVKDDYGNDFSHKADSDGEVVKGEYRTLMADGRTQIVKYTADWKNGYNAEITYEGEAIEQPTRTPYTRPPPPIFTRPTTTERPVRPESEVDIDSQRITPAPVCYPGNTDSRCPQPTQAPFQCYQGSTDPRCPQPPTQRPFQCYPGSNDPRCPPPPTQPPFQCYPGSTDPRCPPPPTQPQFRCYPGSSDPRCPQPTQAPTQPPPRCYQGSTDPRCPPPPTQPQFRCYPGSTDPRCPPPPTPAPTQPPFQCYPGSYDPRCPPPRTQPTRRPTEPPTEPPGLYGAPSLPFGVRNNPKFGYSK